MPLPFRSTIVARLRSAPNIVRHNPTNNQPQRTSFSKKFRTGYLGKNLGPVPIAICLPAGNGRCEWKKTCAEARSDPEKIRSYGKGVDVGNHSSQRFLCQWTKSRCHGAFYFGVASDARLWLNFSALMEYE